MPAWQSTGSSRRETLREAANVALTAAAAVLADAVRDKLRGGYTSGDHVTGANLNSVIVVGPATENGVQIIRVTTRLTDPPYPAFWEYGWTSRAGNFHRVEKWRPAAEESADVVEQTFLTTARAYMDAQGAP